MWKTNLFHTIARTFSIQCLRRKNDMITCETPSSQLHESQVTIPKFNNYIRVSDHKTIDSYFNKFPDCKELAYESGEFNSYVYVKCILCKMFHYFK